MTTKKLTKLLALYLPYILLGLVATNFGEAWRLAEGKELGDKIMSMMGTIPMAFANPLPSLHPLDFLVGLCCGAGLRLAVYLRGKNAKKYRHGMEYGSARWGTPKDIEPFMAPKFADNIILTKTERLMMSNRPPDPKNARNKNVLVVGGSGSGKTRFWLKPNLLQCHSSYVVTDPKGSIVVECGNALLKNGYKLKILNTINFKKSMHYNPFAYVHSEKDILKLVTTLMTNTKGEGSGGDPFWEKSERLLLTALIAYLHYEAPVEEQNFATLLEMLNTMQVLEDDEEYQNPVDLLFEELAKKKPNSFAGRQYKLYKLAAGVVCSKRLLNQAVGKSLRTHNLKPKKGAQVMRKNEKITALYERLSRDDFGKDDDQQRESNSISNQKAMLEEFAARQGFTNIVHFTDDGISGTCFDRPGFLAMMKEVEAGNVEYLCIYTLEDLESRVSEHSAATESLKKTLDEQTARMKAIKQLYDSSAAFQSLKPVYDGLQKIKFEKPRAKYKAEHEAELKQFYAARRKLTGEFPDGKVDMKKLTEEYDELEQAHNTTYGEFKTVRDDLHRLWKVKSCVDTAARFNERTEEQMHQNRPQTRHKKEDISR